MPPKIYYHHDPEPGFSYPIRLTYTQIERFDPKLYGVYLLLHPSDGPVPIVVYVGRGLIRGRMNRHIVEKDARSFVYKPLANDYVGFYEECRLFHKYGKTRHLDNKNHPAVPKGAPLDFPNCHQLGCNGEPD